MPREPREAGAQDGGVRRGEAGVERGMLRLPDGVGPGQQRLARRREDEAVSFQVMCDGQAEIDHFWDGLGEGGEPGRCGWLKDEFGVLWQIVPTALPRLLGGSDAQKAARVTNAFLKMKKFDIAELERAYEG